MALPTFPGLRQIADSGCADEVAVDSTMAAPIARLWAASDVVAPIYPLHESTECLLWADGRAAARTGGFPPR